MNKSDFKYSVGDRLIERSTGYCGIVKSTRQNWDGTPSYGVHRDYLGGGVCLVWSWISQDNLMSLDDCIVITSGDRDG